MWNGWDPVALIEGGVVYYVRADHIGRPVFATNASGVKVWEATYLPFGGVHTQTGNLPTTRFPGQWYQAESGLHQNWMRDYDPTTGRYLEPDPLGLIDGASVYGYVRQNSVRHIDPNGREVYVCRRPVNVSWIPDIIAHNIIPSHNWIKTDSIEAGMGGDCPIPGQGCADSPYVTDTAVTDHTGQFDEDGATCEKMNNVDEQCVNRELAIGRLLGKWNAFNNCSSFAWTTIVKCRTGPQY